MKINYDKIADAAYISIKKGSIKKTVKLGKLLHADLDKNGKVLGIEILNASLKLSKPEKVSSPFVIPVSVTV